MTIRTTVKRNFQVRGAATPYEPAFDKIENPFLYASVSRLSKYQCRACGTHIQRKGIRRMQLCPICGIENEIK